MEMTQLGKNRYDNHLQQAIQLLDGEICLKDVSRKHCGRAKIKGHKKITP